MHTGTADGGHYYSFIKERNLPASSNGGAGGHHERWFLFNDAEVKIFDPSQIATECFGGEMIVRLIASNFSNQIKTHFYHSQSKTYDSVTEKYLDFSFEKTNSAYMLFYERRSPKVQTTTSSVRPEDLPSCSDSNNVAARPCSRNDEPEKLIEVATESRKVAITSVVVANETESNSDLSKCNFTAPIQCDIDNKCSGGVDENDVIGSSSSSSTTPATLNNHASSSSSSHKSSLNALNIPLSATSFLSKELEEWIWQDNRHFLQDRNIFEHTYFK